MEWRVLMCIAIAAILTGGCNKPPTTTQTPGSEATSPPVEIDVGEAAILEQPFTADEIRDEWVPGLRLLIRRSSPDGEVLERWTVVAADDDGADIEYAVLDEAGQVVGEPQVQRSGWAELRDHASFPAAISSREWITRSTALGTFDGWLYSVQDDTIDTVNQFFFVPSMPGAPVYMRTVEGDDVVFELEQTARLRPDTD
jgi:hypothetical protein